MKIAIENLNRLRSYKGFTYNDLAEITGYSKNSIQKLLSYRKESKSRLDIVVAVCRALDIDFPKIFNRGIVTCDRKENACYKSFDTNFDTEHYLNNFVNKVRDLNHFHTNYHIKTVSGLSESTISDLLNFKTKNPRMETLLKITKGLEISEEEIFR